MTRNRNVRNTTKFKRSIKAISPVIATLLMIAIAVVASLVVYAWVTGYIGGATNKAGNAIQIQSFAPKDGNLVVYVQNVGQGVVQLKPGTSLYVNGDLVPIIGDGPITIAEGQTVELDTNYEYSGEKVSLKITTTGGTFTQTLGMSTAGSGGGLILPKYTLTVNPSAQGSVARSPNQAQYTSGTSVMLTATSTVDGYTFQSWSGDVPTADVNSNPVTIKMDSNKDVTPTFVQTPYSLDARTTGNGRGTITPDPVAPYTFGQTVRLTAETDISSTFGGWTGDGTVDSQNPLVYIVRLNGDKTATASFIIKTFTITPQTVTNGQITPNTAQTVNYGTDSDPFTVTASTAGNGYRIINVFDGTTILGGAGLTTFPYTFQNVIANHQISATFEPIPSSHIVHFDMGTGGQLIDPTEGDHTYTDDQVVQLGATAAGTYHFELWTATGTDITFDDATLPNAQATIRSEGTITANFEPNSQIGTIYPKSVSYEAGSYFSGALSDMQSSDGNYYVIRSETSGNNRRIDSRFTFDIDDISVSRSDVTKLDVTLESHYSSTRDQTVYIWNSALNWGWGDWQSMETTNDIGSSPDVTITFSITSNFNNYIGSNGEMVLRIRTDSSSSTFYGDIDWFKIDVTS